MIDIVILAIAFTAGVLAGGSLLLRIGSARDPLRGDPGTGSGTVARKVLGLYVRMPGSPGSPQ